MRGRGINCTEHRHSSIFREGGVSAKRARRCGSPFGGKRDWRVKLEGAKFRRAGTRPRHRGSRPVTGATPPGCGSRPKPRSSGRSWRGCRDRARGRGRPPSRPRRGGRTGPGRGPRARFVLGSRSSAEYAVARSFTRRSKRRILAQSCREAPELSSVPPPQLGLLPAEQESASSILARCTIAEFIRTR